MAVPQFTKSPPELVERFDAAAARHPAAARRKMFGYPALFVGGNLATGLFADTWMVRLAPADLAALVALPGAAPFAPMPGRTMKGYATLPPDVVAQDAELDAWLERAITFAGSLPAKP
jgi:TfoX/Sxy family transcriptional regulator of competence genes